MAAELPQPLPRIPALEDILPAAHHHNTERGILTDAITAAVSPLEARFDNVIKPLVGLENSQSGEKAVIAALKYCALDPKVQHASEEAEEIWKAASAVVDRRVDLYNLVKSVGDRNESLDFEDEKVLARMLMRYAECGYGVLEGNAIKTWLDTEEEIERLCTQFHRNIREYSGGLWLADDELDGLEERYLDRHPPREEDEKRFFSDMRDAWTVESRAHNPETRKKMMVSFSGKLSENVPLFKDVIQLRNENARRLGYKSHAASRIPYRIADCTEWIDDLLKKLLDSALPFAKRNFEKVPAKKREVVQAARPGEDGAEKLLPWDVFYYGRLVDQEEGPSNFDAIAEYFPLQNTVEAMLRLFSDCLQLRFEALPGDVLHEATWSNDVHAWAVWDERPDHLGAFIGYLYADLLERPGKYRGNQCVNLQPVSDVSMSLAVDLLLVSCYQK
ncbi:hypothetical protein IMZ48_46925 [Candidatus Bathyarchaeota archaeon]|nr:hypothetical protein [Candidatus Bathyarchaeota archaeon]